MKYYASESDEIFAYESDGSQDGYIKEGLTLLDDEGLARIRAKQEAASAPSPEQVLQSALAKRDELLSQASLRISPLQDATDLDDATPEEAASLKKWKQYRLAVNRVADQVGFPSAIEWPNQP